jgi:glutathionylspermidine synthase
MKRELITPRDGWQDTVTRQGLVYRTVDDCELWNESACYRFTGTQIEQIAVAAEQVHAMCMQAVDAVVSEGLWDMVGIPEPYRPLVTASWKRRDKHLYGRFDFAYDGSSSPKLLEYNADTPTALIESAVTQWYWMKDVYPNTDQFNSIHEDLIARWGQFGLLRGGLIHFASMDTTEDIMTCGYLRDTAEQAGFKTEQMGMSDIGWDRGRNMFVDTESRPMSTCFKLYPWEWLFTDQFGANLQAGSTRWLEPAWKSILSSKGILVVLHTLFPSSPYILPAAFNEMPGHVVRKPLRSREGANVRISRGRDIIEESDGPYGTTAASATPQYIWQQAVELPSFDGMRPVMGAWMIGDKASGLGIREDQSRITSNLSAFIPHYFTR